MLKRGRNFKPSIVWAAALVVVLLGAWGVSQLSRTRAPDTPPPSVPVRLGVALEPGSVMMMVAVDRGFILQEGLEPAVHVYPSGKAAMQDGLFEQQADIITTTNIPVVLAAFSRQDFKVVATIFKADNINRIVARKDAGIARPEDLRGKRIATQKGSAVHQFLNLMLEKYGIPTQQIELRQVTPQELPGLPKALADGKFDAISVREPFTSEAKAWLGKNAMVFDEPGLYTQFEVVVVRESLLREHPEIVVKLLRALFKAADFTSRQPGQTKAVMASWLGISLDKAEQLWPVWEPRVTLDQNLTSTLETTAKWAIQQNLVKRDESPAYGALLDGGALRSASSVGGNDR
ncbi:MAG: ABC transporter substrate-binding protein [Sulfuricella sp.]